MSGPIPSMDTEGSLRTLDQDQNNDVRIKSLTGRSESSTISSLSSGPPSRDRNGLNRLSRKRFSFELANDEQSDEDAEHLIWQPDYNNIAPSVTNITTSEGEDEDEDEDLTPTACLSRPFNITRDTPTNNPSSEQLAAPQDIDEPIQRGGDDEESSHRPGFAHRAKRHAAASSVGTELGMSDKAKRVLGVDDQTFSFENMHTPYIARGQKGKREKIRDWVNKFL